MENIIIYGAGGFGREVQVLIKQINADKPTYNVLGFADDNPAIHGTIVNGLEVLGNISYLSDYKSSLVVAVGVLSHKKKEIVEQLKKNENLVFSNLFHPDIYWDETNTIGMGNILCHGMNVTCNVTIGDFNAFNGRVGIGHDVNIGNYNLFGPNSFIAGEVKIDSGNVLAMNSSVLQQKKIGSNNVLNMNSVLIRNIKDNGVYFGVPALKQTF